MSQAKRIWCDAFETVEREFPNLTVDEQNALAEALVVDRFAARADELVDRAKYEGLPVPKRLHLSTGVDSLIHPSTVDQTTVECPSEVGHD